MRSQVDVHDDLVTAATQTPTLAELAASDSVPDVGALTHVVALDGPAGTGKSSVARGVAAALGWRFVDTGATYRAVTVAVLDAGVDPADGAAVLAVAQRARLALRTDPADPMVALDGVDVSSRIRTPEVTAHVSAVSAVGEVRRLLIAAQRAAAGTRGAVVEGRDIATVVAPLAEVKVYLDARPEVRAARRAGDAHAGVTTHHTTAEALHAAVGNDLTRRDNLDSQTNKLVASDGAVHLDTSDLSLDQVIAEVVRLVQQAERIGNPAS